MNYLSEAALYVIRDMYFLPSMALVVMVGLFIGALVYDGDMKQVRKAMAVLISYTILLIMTNLARITPFFEIFSSRHVRQPLAGVMTIVFVTFFYLLGMFLGVVVTSKAHKNHE